MSSVIAIDDSVAKAAAGSELEFQSFSFTEGSSSSKGKYKPVASDDSPADWQTPPPGAPKSNLPGSTPNYPIYSIEYYMKYFDVDTNQVLSRMLRSILFWKNDFIEFLGSNPDLYGPFWVPTTVIFVLFVTGNISGSVNASMNGTQYSADFQMLTIAASSIYSYVFIGSLILWGFFRYYQVSLSLLEIVSLYGYAMSVFIPISIICVVPLSAVKWSFSMLAFVTSGLFLAGNIWKPLHTANKGLALLTILVILGCHLGMTLLFKFVFFTYEKVDAVVQPTTAP